MMANFIGQMIFGGIGFIAFVYGKKMSEFRLMVIGILLMAFPYVVSNNVLLYVIGIGLTVALFIFRE